MMITQFPRFSIKSLIKPSVLFGLQTFCNYKVKEYQKEK